MARNGKLTPDKRNANRGTERGRYMLEASLRELGAGRSIVADAHGKIVAGNKTFEVAQEIGIERVRIIETDGNEIIVAKRTDWDLDDPSPDNPARKYAYADNRISEIDLDFDPGVFAEDIANGLDLSAFWFDEELADIQAVASVEFSDADNGDRGLKSRAKSISPVIPIEDIAIIERALKATGEKNRGKAFIKLCKAYLNEEGQFDFSF